MDFWKYFFSWNWILFIYLFFEGGLLNWDTSTPSVWLTAWALRTFSIIWFQDWEDFIYVDPKVCYALNTLSTIVIPTYFFINLQIVSSGAIWLLNFQDSHHGYFQVGNYNLTKKIFTYYWLIFISFSGVQWLFISSSCLSGSRLFQSNISYFINRYGISISRKKYTYLFMFIFFCEI